MEMGSEWVDQSQLLWFVCGKMHVRVREEHLVYGLMQKSQVVSLLVLGNDSNFH